MSGVPVCEVPVSTRLLPSHSFRHQKRGEIPLGRDWVARRISNFFPRTIEEGIFYERSSEASSGQRHPYFQAKTFCSESVCSAERNVRNGAAENYETGSAACRCTNRNTILRRVPFRFASGAQRVEGRDAYGVSGGSRARNCWARGEGWKRSEEIQRRRHRRSGMSGG